MKRNIEEIKTILDRAGSSGISFSDCKFQKRMNDRELAWIPDIAWHHGDVPVIKVKGVNWTVPNSPLTDPQFTAHFKHDLRLNVLGVVCKTCHLVLERG